MMWRLLPALLLAGLVTLAGCPGKAPSGIHLDSGKDFWLNWPEVGRSVKYDVGSDQQRGDGIRPGDGRIVDRTACAPGCNGCCTAGNTCHSGDSPKQCGAQGSTCMDCTAVDGSCVPGLGCCYCSGKHCGEDDGCGSPCLIGSGCSPSCQELLNQKGLPSVGKTCCEFGCATVEAGSTYDCAHCCAAPGSETACRLPTCAELLAKLGLPNVGMGCCFEGCAADQAGGPGTTSNCNYCCPSTRPGYSACQ